MERPENLFRRGKLQIVECEVGIVVEVVVGHVRVDSRVVPKPDLARLLTRCPEIEKGRRLAVSNAMSALLPALLIGSDRHLGSADKKTGIRVVEKLAVGV